MTKMALKRKNSVSSYINLIPQKPISACKTNRKVRKFTEIFCLEENKKLIYFDNFR